MPTQQNVLVLLIDSLRYDLIADDQYCSEVAPTVKQLRDQGLFGCVLANASNTQFVLPSLLSGSYPLDFGGYNAGLEERPFSLFEAAKRTGRRTICISNCVLYNRALGLLRGVDDALIASLGRRALMQDLEYRIIPPLKTLLKSGGSAESVSEFLGREYRPILGALRRMEADTSRLSHELAGLGRKNGSLGRMADLEEVLLAQEPERLARLISSVADSYYWKVIGQGRKTSGYLRHRIWNKLYMRLGAALLPSHVRLGHIDGHDVLCEELATPSLELLGQAGQPWFSWLHIMDVHSPALQANQLLRVPGLLRQRRRRSRKIWGSAAPALSDGRKPDLRYSEALRAVDDYLSRILEVLKRSGQDRNTAILVTADHGNAMVQLDGCGPADLPDRLQDRDLATPFILWQAQSRPSKDNGVWDSRDLCATLADLMGVEMDGHWAGKSILRGDSRGYAVAENAGRGHCDIARDVLNFSIADARHRAVFRHRPGEAEPEMVSLLDRSSGSTVNSAQISRVLSDALMRERRGLLGPRGASLRGAAA